MAKSKGKLGKASVSAKKVAELAGVSRSAVSRTFTDGASVSARTRAKVMAAAESLGYHVNHLARGLGQHRSGIVCLIAAEMQTPFEAMLVEAATRRLQAMGKVVLVLNTAGQPASVEAAMGQTLNYRAEATVVISGAPPAQLIATCIAHGQGVILINRDAAPPGAQVVMIENEVAAAEACFLLTRAGCRSLAVVGATAGTPGLSARENAFVAAAAAAGIEAMVCRAGPADYDTGVESARRLLAGARRPDGVFCVTDLLALGFMEAARIDFRMQIPEDLCVVGFGDIPAAGWLGSGLTTFREPLDDIVRHIADLLKEEDGPQETLHRVPAQLVWRRSLRP